MNCDNNENLLVSKSTRIKLTGCPKIDRRQISGRGQSNGTKTVRCRYAAARRNNWKRTNLARRLRHTTSSTGDPKLWASPFSMAAPPNAQVPDFLSTAIDTHRCEKTYTHAHTHIHTKWSLSENFGEPQCRWCHLAAKKIKILKNWH